MALNRTRILRRLSQALSWLWTLFWAVVLLMAALNDVWAELSPLAWVWLAGLVAIRLVTRAVGWAVRSLVTPRPS